MVIADGKDAARRAGVIAFLRSQSTNKK